MKPEAPPQPPKVDLVAMLNLAKAQGEAVYEYAPPKPKPQPPKEPT